MTEPENETATKAAATAGDYRPEIDVNLRYDGTTLVWKRTPAEDRAKFVATIRGYVADLKDTYRVRPDLDGSGDLQLRLDFKGASTATDRQIMKGNVFMIIGDTIWGGGGS